MAGEIDLLQDFRDIVAGLESEGIEYAVVGALALAVHGFPRATTDIDFLIRTEDVTRALSVAEPVGYRFAAEPIRFRSGLTVQRVTKVVGREHLIVDFLLLNDALEGVWSSRHRVASEEGSIVVVSREGLIEMKAAAGRPQDLVDIERLRSGDDG